MSGMTRPGKSSEGSFQRRCLCAGLLASLFMASLISPLEGQVPRDQIHLAISLGGFVRVGIGVTHWIEKHHAVEFTAYPLVFPWDGHSIALKGGYNWIPSDEVWRAKLGGSATLLIHKPRGTGGWVTPLLSFNPGLNYVPDDERFLRVDLPMSYYLTEEVFAPSGIEILYGMRK